MTFDSRTTFAVGSLSGQKAMVQSNSRQYHGFYTTRKMWVSVSACERACFKRAITTHLGETISGGRLLNNIREAVAVEKDRGQEIGAFDLIRTNARTPQNETLIDWEIDDPENPYNWSKVSGYRFPWLLYCSKNSIANHIIYSPERLSSCS